MSPAAIYILLATLSVLAVLLMSLVWRLFVMVEQLGRADDAKRVRLEAAEKKLAYVEAYLELPGSWDEPTLRRGRPAGRGG